jgi:hypothetical protein
MKLTFPLALAALAGCSSHHAMSSGYSTDDTHTIVAAEPDHRSVADLKPSEPPILLPGQPTYATPEEAVAALHEASARKDLPAVARIIGLPSEDLITTDDARNASIAEFFAREYDASHHIVLDGDTAHVFIGADNFALASPLVKQDSRWYFDSAGGKQALIERYIDENESATIGVCRAYVQAQYEYYAEDREGDDVLEYAQRLASSKGQHDGLYWHTDNGERESPLGPLIAEARARGYLKGSPRKLDDPRPYHGYLFQILTRQGASAPGGAHDYIINNHMIAGFALIAYPAKYGKSGTMTFQVGANGKVYEKDLGQRTGEIADGMEAFNPDSTWMLVGE